MRKLLISLTVVLCVAAGAARADYTFQPPECEYSIQFPEEPEFYEEMGDFAAGVMVARYSAELGIGAEPDINSEVVRAECMIGGWPLSQQSLSHGHLEQVAREMAQHFLVPIPDIRVWESPLGPAFLISGNMYRSNSDFRLEFYRFYATHSFLSFSVQAHSATWPELLIYNFLWSVRRDTP